MRYVDSALNHVPDDCLAAWLDRELQTASAVTLRSGFYSLAALDVVQGRMEELLGRGGELLAVLGGDLLQLDIDALLEMLDICARFPEKARVYVVIEPVFQNAKTYHVQHPDGRRSAWVGSANFTTGGFTTNLEAAITVDSAEDDPNLVEQVRAATLAATEQPGAAVLDQGLIQLLERRVQESQAGFGRAALGRASQLFVDHGTALLDHLDRMASGHLDHWVVQTGFEELDDALGGGLRPGTLTVLASRPGMGRSTLVLNMLTRAAITREVAACLFTFDTTELEVLLRVVSSETAINHADLRSARMTDADWQGLAKNMITICDAPLYVNSGAAPHLEGLCAAISTATAQHALDLVAIDPLSAVFARSFADNREREVAEVVRRLKALAMQLRIPIIATAELGRQADYPTWRPGLGDLRDTDVIAQVADIVILLHPPDATNQSRPRAREADLTVVKNRYGRRTTIALEKRLNVARFHTLALPEEEK